MFLHSPSITHRETLNQVVEDDEEEDGPPPGFQCIITPQLTHVEKVEPDEEDEDEGPPPGFDSITSKPQPSLSSSDLETSIKQQDSEDDDGPPPGWELSSLANALPQPSSNTPDIKTPRNEEVNDGSNEDEDEGPPPGWETVLPHQLPPPVQPLPAVSSDLDMSNNDVEQPQSVSRSTVTTEQLSPPTPLLQHQPPAAHPSDDINSKGGDMRNRIKRHTTGKQSAFPTPHSSTPSAASSSPEKAQLVCGTCRKLCLYPRGAKWVQCPGCQEVNFVLEAHEVGQVKCGGCETLLMYPYGVPAVQCTSCRFVTEIGAHNKRAPLSVQQAQRRRNSNRRH